MNDTIKQINLFKPELEEVVPILKEGLLKNFETVKVEICDCPNLSNHPYNLASQGICNNCHLLDIGGPPNIAYLENHDVHFDLENVAKDIGFENSLYIGAGAANCCITGKNAELMPNTKLGENKTIKTKSAKLDKKDNCLLENYNTNTFGGLGNFFISDGSMDGKVLKIECHKRTGERDFVNSIRQSLRDVYSSKNLILGMGGVFLVQEGKVKSHIMPDFAKENLDSEEKLEKWIKFFDVDAPVTVLSTLITEDYEDFDLRVEHSHFIGEKDGGHYHYDTTPDTVKYVGYYVLAESLLRVGQPKSAPKNA